MFIIRFAFYFSLSFVILCIPIRNQSLFYYLEDMTYPLTSKLFETVEKKVETEISRGIRNSKKLFNNSTPSDEVKSQMSSRKKVEIQDEGYTPEEKDALLRVMQEER